MRRKKSINKVMLLDLITKSSVVKVFRNDWLTVLRIDFELSVRISKESSGQSCAEPIFRTRVADEKRDLSDSPLEPAI